MSDLVQVGGTGGTRAAPLTPAAPKQAGEWTGLLYLERRLGRPDRPAA